MGNDQSTEEKIKQAAQKLFMQKGYAGTRTRDIAEEAGINLALLNYYFRSKEKLFHQIMLENLQQFFGVILTIFKDEHTDLITKLEQLTEVYVTKLIDNPEMPMFILSEIRNDPETFISHIAQKQVLHQTSLYHQMQEMVGNSKMKGIDPLHLMVNFLGMLVFPFLARPLLTKLTAMEDAAFNQLMEERKKLIPLWIQGMVS
jgi:AcrR family transcriptional regulator